MSTPTLVLSCEHGGNAVPERWAHLFTSAAARADLDSHRGWDRGAAEAATALAEHTGAPLLLGTSSRLLVDLNRSLHHPRLFSAWSRGLAAAERAAVLEQVWHPHRNRVRAALQAALAGGGPVLHLAVHSFTPELDPVRRDFDLGLLYDPSRQAERALCADWAQRLRDAGVSVRRNQPYRGVSDGLCTALRREFGEQYVGVELELNQDRMDAAGWERLLPFAFFVRKSGQKRQKATNAPSPDPR